MTDLATRMLRSRRILTLILVHALIGMAASVTPEIGWAHAVIACAGAVLVVLFSHDIDLSIATVFYLGGSEVFWRAVGAPVPYEAPKLIGLAILFSLWFRKLVPAPRGLGVFMASVVLFLPGVWLAGTQVGYSFALEQSSFNLAGPLLLAAAWSVLRAIEAPTTSIRFVLWSTVLPSLCPTAMALSKTFSNLGSINWVNDSNFQTSGGFGPNQLSTVLAFSLLAVVAIALYARPSRLERVALVIIGSTFAFQMFLTFSRTGIYTAGLALALGALASVREPRAAVRVILLSAAAVGVVVLVVFPQVDDLSHGVAAERFTDLNPTHRDQIASVQFDIFENNLPFGVGVGRTKELQFELTGQGYQAHTEYLRLLAEHGVLGIGVMIMWAGMAVATLLATGTSRRFSPWAVTWMSWSVLSMATTATRVAGICLAFGLAAVCIVPARRYDAVPTPARELVAQ